MWNFWILNKKLFHTKQLKATLLTLQKDLSIFSDRSFFYSLLTPSKLAKTPTILCFACFNAAIGSEIVLLAPRLVTQ